MKWTYKTNIEEYSSHREKDLQWSAIMESRYLWMMIINMFISYWSCLRSELPYWNTSRWDVNSEWFKPLFYSINIVFYRRITSKYLNNEQCIDKEHFSVESYSTVSLILQWLGISDFKLMSASTMIHSKAACRFIQKHCCHARIVGKQVKMKKNNIKYENCHNSSVLIYG